MKSFLQYLENLTSVFKVISFGGGNYLLRNMIKSDAIIYLVSTNVFVPSFLCRFLGHKSSRLYLGSFVYNTCM